MTSAKSIPAAERREQALLLRKAGYQYEAIGAKLGISKQAAHQLIQRTLRATLREPAADLRTLEVERLDDLLRALYPQARKGNHGAIDRVLRIMERRAKLLGLDAPVRSEVETNATISATVFSHEGVAAAIAARSGAYRQPPGADEGRGDGATLGQDLHGGDLRADGG